MHSRLNRLLTLLALLICLPLQGLAAAVMPLCAGQTQEMEMHAAASADDMACCDHHSDDGQPAGKTSCDQCSICHLGSGQALIPGVVALNAPGFSPMVAAPLAHADDPRPSLLFHPPRSVPALG